MSDGLTKKDVDKLDEKLKFYCWPPHSNFNETDLSKLENAQNFNSDTYDEAVAIYIYWKKEVYFK